MGRKMRRRWFRWPDVRPWGLVNPKLIKFSDPETGRSASAGGVRRRWSADGFDTMKARIFRAFFAGLCLAVLSVAAASADDEGKRSGVVLGCWGNADKGDSADLKLYFVGNGSLVQYDENKTEKLKRTFGAWEMQAGSTYLTIYWPAGNITSYTVKRIGPILHFSGMNGASNFTLRLIPKENCWSPQI